MLRLCEVIDCLCEGEVVYPRIAQGQIQQLQKVMGATARSIMYSTNSFKSISF